MRLRRSDCSAQGIGRLRRGRGFGYVDADGHPLDDGATLERIRALAIPPAWHDVWICPDARGHLQATGVDAAGRKQYLYHPLWRERRDRQKFRDMEEFGHVLPRLRARVRTGLNHDGEPSKERVAACATRLLDIGLFRIGGEEYADDNGGVGLATLRREHLTIGRDEAIFDYLGKGGIHRLQRIVDPASVAVLRQLARRRGGPEELLAYREQRAWHRLGTDGINDYVKAGAGSRFSAKDFRTWNATVLAAAELAAAARAPGSGRAAAVRAPGRGSGRAAAVRTPGRGSGRAAAVRTPGALNRQRVINAVIDDVAEMLGNTRAVARRSYVDPRVIDSYLAGVTIELPRRDLGPLDELSERGRRRLELALLKLLA